MRTSNTSHLSPRKTYRPASHTSFSQPLPTALRSPYHLVAQAKPKETTPEQKRVQAITQLTTILGAEYITFDFKVLESRINAVANSEHTAKADEAGFSADLHEDLKLGKGLTDKVLDNANAALGL